MNTLKKHNKGFTLIELLVVISVISLLSSIIFASLQSSRVKAAHAKDIVQTNEIRKAIEFYRNDNKNYPSGDNSVDLEDAIVPEYISEIPEISKIGLEHCPINYLYYSNDNVAKTSTVTLPEFNIYPSYYRCGPGNSPDSYVIAYLTTSDVPNGHSLYYFSGPGNGNGEYVKLVSQCGLTIVNFYCVSGK